MRLTTGASEMEKKTLLFQMRTTPEFLARLDEWRRYAKDIPARAEAIRRLVGEGIASHYLRNRGDHLLKMLEDLHKAGRLSEEEWSHAQSVSDACIAEAIRLAADISGGDGGEPRISAETWHREMTVDPDPPSPFLRGTKEGLEQPPDAHRPRQPTPKRPKR